MDNIRLIITDLDGTLLTEKPEFELYNEFRDRMFALRTRHGIKWAICTGRSMQSFSDMFLPMRTFGVVPDYVITRHAYIFSMGRRGFAPHLLWNIRIKLLQGKQARLLRGATPRLARTLRARYPFSKFVDMGPGRICVRFEDPRFAQAAADVIRQAAKPYHYLRVFQFRNEIDVRTVPFTKGLALSELTRHLSISPNHVLAIGNGHNDASMMDKSVARFVACPVNAEPEIIKLVHDVGGHISTRRTLAAVLDALDAYTNGTVCSDLPEGWRDPLTAENPAERRIPRGRRRKSLPGLLLFLAGVYAVLAVFAYFGMLPFSEAVLKPLRMFLPLVRKVLPFLPG
jgi:HAD superfamily hydrolase (TIGR01484 family)